MSKPGDGGLFIFLPDKLSEKILSWQKKLNETEKPMPKPHITLIYPSFFYRSEWPDNRKSVVECIKKFKPFTLELSKIDIFTDPYFLWVGPGYNEQNKKLFEMNEMLVKKFEDRMTGLNLVPYTPHVSVGTYISENNLDKAKIELTELLKTNELTFKVKEVFYTVLDTDFRWKIHDLISLGV
ncbi:MAG: 2'-5' RNA ligase family protein [Candidatus Delongbacteria bacterium]|jgi:2'-5' RNA ligase|nr:2'-5' RNA ligase family protein [Candidatus Delongbacteria bacterium]